VLRGELLVLPIEGSLLYVQPVYLRAEGGRIPELKRVIVAHEGQVAMAETLDAALVALFGPESGPAQTGAIATLPAAGTAAGAAAPEVRAGTPSAGNAPGAATADLVRRALEHYERARAAQRGEDWSAYGVEMRRLGEVLQQLEGVRGRRP
jgi:uncharacterized membrane protein (UPF0182 family)